MKKNKKINFAVLLTIFIVLGFVSLKVPFTKILGTETNFTLFDMYAPTAASFFGGFFGIVAVFGMRLINIFVTGSGFSTVNVLLFLPVIAGTLYFAKKNKINLIIPILAIIIWNLNPVGRSVWYYSMYWLIPIAAYFLREKSLFIRSLGATFTQHSVGGVLFLYAFNLPAEFWIGLIPIVILERLIIASGMTLSYIALNNIFAFLKKKISIDVNISKKLNFLKK